MQCGTPSPCICCHTSLHPKSHSWNSRAVSKRRSGSVTVGFEDLLCASAFAAGHMRSLQCCSGNSRSAQYQPSVANVNAYYSEIRAHCGKTVRQVRKFTRGMVSGFDVHIGFPDGPTKVSPFENNLEVVSNNLSYVHRSVNAPLATSLLHTITQTVNAEAHADFLQQYHGGVSSRKAGDDLDAQTAALGEPTASQHVESFFNATAQMTARLRLTTYNGNTWNTIKQFLGITDSNVVCVQEHRLEASQILEARIWARDHGWASHWACGMRTQKGALAAGVAIFVRAYIHSWAPLEWECVVPHRALGVVVSCGGLGPIGIFSIYMLTNSDAKKRVTPFNFKLLSAIGDIVTNAKFPCVLAGDWQCEPSILEGSGWPVAAGLNIVCAEGPMGSCRSAKGNSCIDYLLCTKEVGDVIAAVEYSCLIPPRPQLPVCLVTVPRPRSVQVQVIKQPPKLPPDFPFGPLPSISEWSVSEISRICDPIQDILPKDGDAFYPVFDENKGLQSGSLVRDSLDVWLGLAQENLVTLLGGSKTSPHFGVDLRFVSVNVLNTFRVRTGGGCLESKALRWAQCRLQDFARAVERVNNASSMPGTLWKSLNSLRGTLDHTCSSTGSKMKTPFSKFKLASRNFWHRKIRECVRKCRQLIATYSTATMPDHLSLLARGVAACCNCLAIRARIQAEAVEVAFVKDKASAWNEWLLIAEQNSASMGHKYVKKLLKTEYDKNYDDSRCRSEILAAQVGFWSNLWHPVDEQEHHGVPDLGQIPVLPPLTPSDLRKASLSFARRTCDIGGVHPRHISLLSDEALRCLICILHASESLGFLPSNVAQLVMVLFPKLDGGSRPIGLFQGLFRVWAAARRPLVEAWEKGPAASPCFAAAKGRSANDVVWRSAFKAELANSQSMHFAALLGDLHKCYEFVRHADLARSALKHHYPLALIRVTIRTYRNARYVSMHGIFSPPIHILRGIVA